MPDTLTCPACRSEVAPHSAGCRSCHLPIADVTRHQGLRQGRRRASIATRLWGLLVYGGIVAWCLLALPTAAVFVVPAAIAAAVLHVLRGKVLVAAIVFLLVVAVAPVLFWPSLLTDVANDLGIRL